MMLFVAKTEPSCLGSHPLSSGESPATLLPRFLSDYSPSLSPFRCFPSSAVTCDILLTTALGSAVPSS
jgi:hypothetical protein